MTKRLRGVGLAAVLSAIAFLLVPALIYAHEHRHVGDYELIVGWLDEPAYVNQPNSVSFGVMNTKTNQPVEGLEQSVKVELSYGGQTQTLDLRPRFGEPGSYVADVMPTQTGDYVMTFTGTIEAIQLNERFDSADGEFSSVESLERIAFPETPASLGQVQERVSGVSTVADAAQASAGTALIVGIIGIVVGVVGLIVAAVALAQSRRAATPAQRPVSEAGRA